MIMKLKILVFFDNQNGFEMAGGYLKSHERMRRMNEKYFEDDSKEFRYVKTAGGIRVVAYSGVKDNVKIPSTIEGMPVVELGINEEGYVGAMPFDVLIPKSVRHIDVHAINSLAYEQEWIDSSPVYNDGWFRKFTLEAGNEHLTCENGLLIEDGKKIVFCRDTTVKSVAIPEGIEVIGEYAFRECADLEEVIFSKETRVIEDHAFDGCKIKSIDLPDGLEKIGYSAFNNHFRLEERRFVLELSIPASVTEIYPNFGVEIKNIEQNHHLVICDGFLMTADKKTIFWYMGENAGVLGIPDDAEVIAPYACSVYALNQLKKLTLGASLKRICTHAFGENKLKTLRIPAALERMDDAAFDFSSISPISVDERNKRFYADQAALYQVNEDGKYVLMYCFQNEIEEYSVREGTEKILDGAFGKCTCLKKVALPDSLEELSEYSFGTSIQKINVPKNVKNIVFSKNYSGITYVLDAGNTAYHWDNHVLYKAVGEGFSAVRFDGGTDEVTLKQGTVSIAPYAFSQTVKKVNFPDSVRRIEHHAFEQCRLKEINLNEGLEVIDYLAFAGNEIHRVWLPGTLNYICVSAFYHSWLRAYAVAANSAAYAVQNDALYSKDFTILYDVPEQKRSTEFIVASQTVDICRAFRGCSKIEAIRLPGGIKNIWLFAIYDCRMLKDIYFKRSPSYINSSSINYWFPIVLHTEINTPVADMVNQLQIAEGGRVKLTLAIKKMEDVQGLSEDFVLTPNETGVTLVKNKSEKKRIVVPSEIGGYPVTEIGAFAFAENNRSFGWKILEAVELPDTVQVIGESAFSDCRNLTDIRLPNGIKTIPSALFDNCERLTEIVIPKGVRRIEDRAFFGCENLLKLDIPESVEYISDWVFTDEDGEYKDLYLNPKTIFVVKKGSYAEKFFKAYKPESVEVDHFLVVYEDPRSTSVSEEEIEALKYFDYIVNDDTTIEIYEKTFMDDLPSDEIVRIPATIRGMPVTKWNAGICDYMKEIHIPASIRSIENLEGVTLWLHEPKLERIIVADDNPNYWADGQALYTKDRTILLRMFDYQTEKYTVCKDTTTIGKMAFSGFINLKKLVLSDKLQEIQTKAFERCSNLEEIIGIENVPNIADDALESTPYYKKRTVIFSKSAIRKYGLVTERVYAIPDGTTEISGNAFQCTENKDMLEEVIVPASVRVIGKNAFWGRKKLVKINIPQGVERIESGTFKGCESLRELYIPASVTEIALDAFPEYEEYGTVPVPAFARIEVDENNLTYKSINGILYSKDGKTLLKAPANYTECVTCEPLETIGARAFAGNVTIRRVVLADSVKCISEEAFCKCTALEEINLKHVQTLGRYAFQKCEKLRSVELHVENVGGHAFESCTSLSDVTLVNTKVIEENAFDGCSNMKRVVLPEGITQIGGKAFARCGLKAVTVPKTVLKTGNESFSECQEITIYDTIDPDAEPCEKYLDEINGSPNSLVGYIGIGRAWALWSCAANHTWKNYEIIVRKAETDEIKYKVWMGSDYKQRKYYCTLASSWGKNATFNFAALDMMFPDIKGTEHKIRVALNRIRYPEKLSNAQRDEYIAYLVRCAKDLITRCIDCGDMETLLFCEPFGVIKKSNIENMLDYAVQKNAVQFSAYLQEYKALHFKNITPSVPKKIEDWSVSKAASTNKVGRYKGSDVDIVFPSEVKGKVVTEVAGTTSKVPDNYRAIVSVVLPEGYTKIGDYAFYGCENLERISLPSTLQSIGKDAFNGCKKLKEVIMPNAVTEIGENSFRNCSSLERVVFSNGLSSIPGYAFAGCDSLTEIDLPVKITSIYKGCFEVYGLQKATIHCSRMYSSGKCFGNEPEVYAYKGAMESVYGITKRSIHTLRLIDIPSETLVKVTVTDVRGQKEKLSFYAESSVDTLQKMDAPSLDKRIKGAADGTAVFEILLEAYGQDFVSAGDNAEEAKKLCSLVFADTIREVKIEEEKKNADGYIETAYKFSCTKQEGMMWENESVGYFPNLVKK